MPITIKDIAQRAGVSRGTVDRVIHRRANVAPYVRQKVENVITELGYRPNVIASRLAIKKQINIAIILPHPSEDAYWNLPLSGIDDAMQEFKHLGIHYSRYFFNLVDPTSLISACDKMKQGPVIDGIIIAPIFKQEAVTWYNDHPEMTVPIIVINSPISLSRNSFYIGQNSYQSGHIAAKLIQTSLHIVTKILIINIGPKALNAEHILEKERGFRDHVKSNPGDPYITKIELEDFSNNDYIESKLKMCFDKHGQFDAVFIGNSRAYRVIDAIHHLSTKNITIIGYDLLAENIQYLKSGHIDYLLDQNPRVHGYKAVKAIADHLIFKASIKETEYLPTSIIIKENLMN